MRRRFGSVLLLVLGLAGPPAMADSWDVQTNSDNTTATRNEIVHGTYQVHDLGALGPVPDEDFYVLGQKPYSSYEVVTDAPSGDFGVFGTTLDLVLSDGTVVASSYPITPGRDYARSLRFINPNNFPQNQMYVRVAGGCGTGCGADDVYYIRLYETTMSVARFNNSGTQLTSLLLQNPTDDTINGFIYYWNVSGGLIATQPFNLGAKQLLNTATGAQTGPVGGSITIAHDGRYGDLQGKAVALEPSTGFTFDTSLAYRPH